MDTLVFFQKGLMMVIMLSLPTLLIGSLVGAIFSLLQALLQLQDQTPAFTVKLIAVGLTLALSGRWIGGELMLLAGTVFNMIPYVGR